VTIPERTRPQRSSDYLAIVTRAIFQAGLSWNAIDARWEAFVRLFEAFDPARVAAFDEGDIERLLADGGIVRSRKKIVATIANARALLEIEGTTTMAAYLRSFARYDDLAADLRKRFTFLGELSAYYLVFRVGEAVPRFETWETTIAGDHPRMREMVTHARACGYDETVALRTEDAALATPTAKKASPKKKTTADKPSESYGPKASADVGAAIAEMESGTLRSGGSGKKVTSRKQAIAIGLSEARRSGEKVPPAPRRTKPT
jgi:3-methyladenine DNA glycosylase Tag